jgi:hypothetical protein
MHMKESTLVFCGDTLPGVLAGVRHPLRGISSALEAADVRFANFEGSVNPGNTVRPATRKKNVLWTTPDALGYLSRCGFDCVNLANNHTFDLGAEGCRAVVEEARRGGIAVCGLSVGGAGVPVALESNGVRFGFLGYADYGFPSMLSTLRKRSIREVARVARTVDALVVSLHWGHEYANRPSPTQRRIARSMIDAGARIVIGHHPHVSQGIEMYKGGLICYSLGNCLFNVDEMPLPMSDLQRDIRYGYLLRVRTMDSQVTGYTVIPVSAFGRDECIVLEGWRRDRGMRRIKELSERLSRRRWDARAWIWDVSGTFALLFRRSWLAHLRRRGIRALVDLCRELAYQPLLVAALCVSFIRFPRRRTGTSTRTSNG